MVNGAFGEVACQSRKSPFLDPYRRTPFPFPFAAANGVAFEFDGSATDILDRFGFGLKKGVVAVGGDDGEETLVAQVLEVGQALLLATAAGPFADVDVVLADDFAVGASGIFVFGDDPGHVEVVTVSHIGHGQLLDESGHAGGLAAIHGRLPSKLWKIV